MLCYWLLHSWLLKDECKGLPFAFTILTMCCSHTFRILLFYRKSVSPNTVFFHPCLVKMQPCLLSPWISLSSSFLSSASNFSTAWGSIYIGCMKDAPEVSPQIVCTLPRSAAPQRSRLSLVPLWSLEFSSSHPVIFFSPVPVNPSATIHLFPHPLERKRCIIEQETVEGPFDTKRYLTHTAREPGGMGRRNSSHSNGMCQPLVGISSQRFHCLTCWPRYIFSWANKEGL